MHNNWDIAKKPVNLKDLEVTVSVTVTDQSNVQKDYGARCHLIESFIHISLRCIHLLY